MLIQCRIELSTNSGCKNKGIILPFVKLRLVEGDILIIT